MKKILLSIVLLITSSAQAEFIYSDFWDLFLEVRRDVRVAEISCDELNEKLELLSLINEDLPEWRQKHTDRIFESQIARKDHFKKCNALFDTYFN